MEVREEMAAMRKKHLEDMQKNKQQLANSKKEWD